MENRVTVTKKDLAAALTLIRKVAPNRCSKPILEDVKIESVPWGLMLSATDLETWIDVGVIGTLAGRFYLAVNAKQLAEAVKAQPKGELVLELDGKKLIVGGAITLLTDDPDEYPSNGTQDTLKETTVLGEDLERLCREVAFATSKDGCMYAYNGVLLECRGNQYKRLVSVATDGRRAAISDAVKDWSAHSDLVDWQAVIPRRTLEVAAAAFKKSREEVAVALQGNRIRFWAREAQVGIYGRLLEGDFPKWRDVVPDLARQSVLALKRDELQAVITQVAALLKDREVQAVELTFPAYGADIVLEASAEGLGEVKVQLPQTGRYSEAKGARANLNPLFLLDFLKALPKESEVIFLGLTEPGPKDKGQVTRAFTLRASASDVLYIFMPITEK